jgi:hypothetical protein
VCLIKVDYFHLDMVKGTREGKEEESVGVRGRGEEKDCHRMFSFRLDAQPFGEFMQQTHKGAIN